MLVSVAVDLNIAQLVDVPNLGVTAILNRDISCCATRWQGAAASPSRSIPASIETARIADVECGCGGICPRRTRSTPVVTADAHDGSAGGSLFGSSSPT